MHIPDNEGKACDAIVRLLEKWTGETRVGIRHPEKDGDGPPVELRLKFPKLQKCKKEGARTVLVLESSDGAFTKFDQIGNLLPNLLSEYTDAPDEIYLVETHTNPWWVYLIKHDGDHWPTVGMPQWNQPIYEEDKLPTAHLPKWYRDALQLDELYTPHPRGWVPATFEENELNDLTKDRDSKRS